MKGEERGLESRLVKESHSSLKLSTGRQSKSLYITGNQTASPAARFEGLERIELLWMLKKPGMCLGVRRGRSKDSID